jgi:hypothetical protein
MFMFCMSDDPLKATPSTALAAALAAFRGGRMKKASKGETFQDYVEAILTEDGLLDTISLNAALRDRGTSKFQRECPIPSKFGLREDDFRKAVVDVDQES